MLRMRRALAGLIGVGQMRLTCGTFTDTALKLNLPAPLPRARGLSRWR